ncbi:hypothetical protein E1200_22805, partial [Actinomadura sp. GC306]|uniref:hypothetical protein n=1 Tax=Actinomadura sp. GC306 TaxID=2530367 RepID=UPI0010446C26
MRSNEPAATNNARGSTKVTESFLRDVRARAPARLPIFRSNLQGELLARLLLGPERELSMLDLAVMLRVDLASVMREVERLARAEILTLRRTLAGRLAARNTGSPLYEPLTRLLMLTFGPAAVVAEEFGGLRYVNAVYLFGPWAARYNGTPGDQPSDVEVLVIGD